MKDFSLVILRLFALTTAFASASSTCSWSKEVDQCLGLRYNHSLRSLDACRDACCADTACEVWQYSAYDAKLKRWSPKCYMGVSNQCGNTGVKFSHGGRSAKRPPANVDCTLSDRCRQGLEAIRIKNNKTQKACYPINHNGGKACWKAITVWQKELMSHYGCPKLIHEGESVFASDKAFCWCGLDMPSSESLAAFNASLESDGLEKSASQVTDIKSEIVKFTETMAESNVDMESTSHRRRLEPTPPTRRRWNGYCYNKWDNSCLKGRGQDRLAQDMKVCAERVSDLPNQPVPYPKKFEYLHSCFQNRTQTTDDCTGCFAYSILCSQKHCLEECACVSYQDKTCKTCMEHNCNNQSSWDVHYDFNYCSGADAPFLQVSNTMNARDAWDSNKYSSSPPSEDLLIV